MLDAGNFWFVYLVIAAMTAFMLSLGLVSISDRDPKGALPE